MRISRDLLASPLGREKFWRAVRQVAWPLLRPAGWAYRRSLLRKTRLTAVTGSFGKTTTTRAISAALDLPQQDGFNHSSRLALKLLGTDRRTRRCVLEVAIYAPGQMQGMARMVRPDIAVLTGIGSEHNRSLPTLQDTLAEKSKLIRALPPDGVALLNADDPLARSAADVAPGAVVTFGFSAEANVRVIDHALESLAGNRLRVAVEGQTIELQTKLVGRHQVYPVLAALAVAHVEGVDLDEAGRRLEGLEAASGRMAPVRLPNGAMVINDTFKGSFESYLQALDTMAELPAERRLVIIGDIHEPPGKQSKAYEALAERLARIPQAVVVHIGRDGKKLRSAARKAGMDAGEFLCLRPDVLPATERIRTLIQPTDVILVKGRESQKFDRIVAALLGETVRCGIRYCNRPSSRCLECPMVARG